MTNDVSELFESNTLSVILVYTGFSVILTGFSVIFTYLVLFRSTFFTVSRIIDRKFCTVWVYVHFWSFFHSFTQFSDIFTFFSVIFTVFSEIFTEKAAKTVKIAKIIEKDPCFGKIAKMWLKKRVQSVKITAKSVNIAEKW